ncbi:MAG: type II toxin-antitoxin system VapC family toxin [Nocardioidaceae bacterium]|nr:type II toxin-antitoxin system VapC family toxin [Nocardioidaceae bacterium]
MILVDTSIWIEHLRAGLETLVRLLDRGVVLAHPWVIGELALGHLDQRREIIGLLGNLSQAAVATTEEVLTLIERHQLVGSGIGYVDAQLLAATRLTPDAGLWTHDSRLGAVAERLGCAVSPPRA